MGIHRSGEMEEAVMKQIHRSLSQWQEIIQECRTSGMTDFEVINLYLDKKENLYHNRFTCEVNLKKR